MSVMQVDPETNTLVRGSSFLRVQGAAEIAQGCDVRLKKLAGEDAWNLADGTRWLELILRKGTPEALILGELQRRILSQPGMQTVDEIDATLEAGDTLVVDWAGTASLSALRESQRIEGRTEITT
jgi:hypothetical protein